jgi:tetratricopeptide (TPR) repeat protein/transcriptional regulator with XRE-family HTH domain
MQKVTPLRSDKAPVQPIVHINTFGAFLRYLREREQMTQSELVSSFPYFFEEYHVATLTLTPDMYRKLEKGKRAAQYEELLPLYAALVGNDFKLSPQERSSFVRLARLKLEGLQRKKPKLRPDGEWRLLEIQLAQIDQDTKAAQEIDSGEQATEKRKRQKSSLDTSHIVGRESWLTTMLSHLETKAKKLVIIQGMMGIGKSSGLKLLLHHLLDREECWPILYSFPTSADITPADHLDTFLAMILAELQVSEPEASKTPPLAKRIEQVLAHLAEMHQRIIFLIDDAQVILDEHGQLSREWQQFLAQYLRSNHQTLMYLATREWAGWTGRERSFVVDGDEAILPPLDGQAGIAIWRHIGFTDVGEDLLEQATARCGGNALMIELRAANLQRPRFSFGWQRNKPQEKKSEHQHLIEQLLTDSHIFGTADVEARKLLQQVIGQRLSHDALQVMEALATTPMMLPFPLLLEINQQAEYAFAELLQASLIDRNAMEQVERAVLQPLAREATIHQLLADKRLPEIEQQLIHAYTIWLEQGTFSSEQEQAMLISELAAAHLKQHHLLEAAELLIEYGWLSYAFGHAPRLARLADEVMHSFNWHRQPEEEVGGLLIQHDLLAREIDKDLGTTERRKAYLHLYEVMNTESVGLKPSTIFHLVHHKLRYLITDKHHAEAWSLIDEICKKYEGFQSAQPVTYTDMLDRRAYVLGRWGNHQDALAKKETDEARARKLQEDAFRLRQEAVEVHQQCVELLQRQERFASPIEQSHMRFKRARQLNDLSYYQRTTGDLEAAKQSMKECLKLKEAGFVIPRSLAVSYDDYGQLLSQTGNFHEAMTYNDHALQIIQKLLDAGQNSILKEKGMLLINRGKLCLLQGKLDDAKALFIEGIPLVEGTSREVSAATAIEGLRTIESWQEANIHHQLDWRWYPRYHQLASYSDIKWLTPTGPFSEEEKLEWHRIAQYPEDEDASKRMAVIIAQSRKRELVKSYEEQREPYIHYPLISQAEIQSKLTGFSQLRTEIEQREPNAIVRRLYLSTIDERLDELNLIAATGRQDDDAFWLYNQRINSSPSMMEMELAIRQLADTLRRGLQYSETEQLCRHIIQQTSYWQIKPMSLEPLDAATEQNTETQYASIDEEQKLFSSEAVGRFFADVFRTYRFPWTVKRDITADHASVSLNLQQLILPGEEQLISLAKIRELLAHEIETHAFRSNAGEKSPLAILSAGLQGFLETEEGLAIYYTQEVEQRGSHHKPNKSWIGTLATGLASGLLCEPYTFRKLLLFLEEVNTLRSLLSENKQTADEIRKDALRSAENRCLRTWRGVAHLSQPGICSTKDSVYLRGYLSVIKALDEGKIAFEQMMVGAVGIHHLGDLAELGITKPNILHRRLATDPDLEKYILQFVG